jgi:hypothetical protein
MLTPTASLVNPSLFFGLVYCLVVLLSPQKENSQPEFLICWIATFCKHFFCCECRWRNCGKASSLLLLSSMRARQMKKRWREVYQAQWKCRGVDGILNVAHIQLPKTSYVYYRRTDRGFIGVSFASVHLSPSFSLPFFFRELHSLVTLIRSPKTEKLCPSHTAFPNTSIERIHLHEVEN